MKIFLVKFNNRKKDFEVKATGRRYAFPYVKAMPRPTSSDQVTEVHVDKELGAEGFSYKLQSGKSGTVHVEQILEYNRDPNYLRDWTGDQLAGSSLLTRGCKFFKVA